MFELFSEIKNSVRDFDKLTSENKFMSNPFNKVLNQTFVWAEKSPVLKRPEEKQPNLKVKEIFTEDIFA